MSEPAVRLVCPAPDAIPTDPAVEPPTTEAAGRKARTAAAPVDSREPLLVDMAGLSRLLARSEASLYRDDSAGRIPAGRKLGGSKRWVYAEIVAWVEAGMPDRRTWETMKNASRSGRPR